MGKFGVKIEDLAKFHINKHIKSGNKANIKRIQKILEELSENPYEGIGNPEPLKYELTGFWSRRINQKDRLVYEIIDHEVVVIIISALGHYNDK